MQNEKIKATEIPQSAINRGHCDWIIEQAEMLKALISYDSHEMIRANKTRALSAIDTMRSSLDELQAYIEEV